MPAFDRRAKDFEAANAQVLGISTDSPFSHENWAKSVGISNYPLLSDVHRTVSKDYGVYWPDWNANVRATFIVDKQGKVVFAERYRAYLLPEHDPGENHADHGLEIQEDGRAARPQRAHRLVPPHVRHRAENGLIAHHGPRHGRGEIRPRKEVRREEGQGQQHDGA